MRLYVPMCVQTGPRLKEVSIFLTKNFPSRCIHPPGNPHPLKYTWTLTTLFSNLVPYGCYLYYLSHDKYSIEGQRDK